MRKQATIVSTHSGRLPISVITTSPRLTPCAASVPASRADSSDDLAERPLAPRAVAGQLDEREPVGRRGVDDVAREVHGAVVSQRVTPAIGWPRP